MLDAREIRPALNYLVAVRAAAGGPGGVAPGFELPAVPGFWAAFFLARSSSQMVIGAAMNQVE